MAQGETPIERARAYEDSRTSRMALKHGGMLHKAAKILMPDSLIRAQLVSTDRPARPSDSEPTAVQTDVLLSPSGDRSGRRSIRAQTDRGHPKVARRGRASHHAAHHAALHGALRGARRIKRRSLLDAAPVVMRGDRRANRRVGVSLSVPVGTSASLGGHL